MTMGELYQTMKDALSYLGLRFSDMDLVTVTVKGDDLTFSYGGKTVTVPLPKA